MPLPWLPEPNTFLAQLAQLCAWGAELDASGRSPACEKHTGDERIPS